MPFDTYVEEGLDIRVGDEVYWTDPDNNFSSGYYKVTGIVGEIYQLQRGDSECEALRHEIK